MQEQEDDFAKSKAIDAYRRLMFEIYTHGPLKLVETDDGHRDLINSENRLCCEKEPFLNAITRMQNEEILEENISNIGERLYSLTERGMLAAEIVRSRGRTASLCPCATCAETFNELMRALLIAPLKLDLGNSAHGYGIHPHLTSSLTGFCCNKKPFLEAICILERYGIVELKLNEHFSYQLTPAGRSSAKVMLAVIAPAMQNPALN